MVDLCSVCGHSKYFHIKGGELDPQACIVNGLNCASHTFVSGVARDMDHLLLLKDFQAEPILYLRLNGDANDKAGLVNNGTWNAAETYTTGVVAPTTNGAGNFDGTKKITISNESDYDFENTDAFSIELWAKWTSTVSEVLISNHDAVANQFRGVEINVQSGGRVRFMRRSTNSPSNFARTDTLASYNDGNWHHIVCTCAGGIARSNDKIYVDGVLETPTSPIDTLTTTILNNIPFVIGDRNDGAGLFNGQIDNVAIWDFELSAAAVAALYNEGNGLIILA